jgi:hypothetical protein
VNTVSHGGSTLEFLEVVALGILGGIEVELSETQHPLALASHQLIRLLERVSLRGPQLPFLWPVKCNDLSIIFNNFNFEYSLTKM